MKNKRGIVSISTFSLIIFLLILMFSFVYYFYSNSVEDIENLNKKQEILNSLISFRTEIIDLSLKNNSYMNYTNKLDSQEFIIEIINNSRIKSEYYSKSEIVSEEISMFGIEFCDDYLFATRNLNTFYNNGSCLSLITS